MLIVVTSQVFTKSVTFSRTSFRSTRILKNQESHKKRTNSLTRFQCPRMSPFVFFFTLDQQTLKALQAISKRFTFSLKPVLTTTKLIHVCNVWLYKHADFDKFNTLISDTDWHQLTTEANEINHVTAVFSSTFLKHVRKWITEKFIAIRPSDKPWLDSALRREIRNRN